MKKLHERLSPKLLRQFIVNVNNILSTQTWSQGGGLLDEGWLEPDTCPKRANMFRENGEPCTRAENANKEN